MPRYEEMDEILGRISGRPADELEPAPHSPGPGVDAMPAISLRTSVHDSAMMAMRRLFGEAEALHELLAPEQVATMTQEQHDELLSLLGKVLQELWQCEVALQRVAPYD